MKRVVTECDVCGDDSYVTSTGVYDLCEYCELKVLREAIKMVKSIAINSVIGLINAAIETEIEDLRKKVDVEEEK